MNPLHRQRAGIAIAVATQLGILSSMVMGQVRLLTNGREIVLPIVPIDPRDLFRGDYVTLAFPISSLSSSLLDPSAPLTNSSFYVTATPAPDGTWTPTRISADRPTPASPDIVLKARSRWGHIVVSNNSTPPRTIPVQYGIERYYVPEGKGPRLEKLARDKKLSAIVAVGADGSTAIKGLMIDGQRVYDEPLY
jgi:uncharacterized membrane-anchored protein